ncbi:MAG TPA: autotransporter domain-containing protein, partial [Reyranella sp.]
IVGNIAVTGSLTFSQSTAQTLNNVITGSGSVIQAGAGTLTLGGANTYGGGTSLTAGLVNFSAVNNFGSGTITLDGGGLQWATGTSTDISGRLAAIGVGGTTFDTNGNDVTFGTSLSGAGGFTKTGSGTLTINNATSYSGAMTVLAGTLSLGASTSGLPHSSDLTLAAAGATFDISNVSNVSSAFSMRDLSGVAGTTINLGSNQLQVGQGSSNSTTFAGVMQGSGSFSTVGSGTLTLTGDNTYTGTTAVVGGVLALKDSGSIAGSRKLFLDSGSKLDISQTSAGAAMQGVASGLPGNGIVALGGQTLTITGTSGSDGGASFSGVIQDSAISGATGGGLVIGDGTHTASQTLGGVNTYTGGTTINTNGTLIVNGDAALGGTGVGMGGVTFNGGTLETAVSFTSNRDMTLTTAGNTRGGIFQVDSAGTTLTLGGVLSGAGHLFKSGDGTLTLTGTNTFAGSAFIDGGTLALSGTGSIASASVLFDAVGTTFDISQTSSGASVAGLTSSGGMGAVVLGGKTLTLTGTGGTFSGVIQDGSASGGLIVGDGIHPAQQSLSGVNIYTGATTIKANSTLLLAGSGSIATSSGLSLESGATFDISQTTSGTSVAGLSGGTGAVSLGSKTLTITGTGGTFGGVIQDGGLVGGLTIGNGTPGITQTLGGVNTYSGATTINDGSELRLSGGSSIASSAVSFNAANASLNISGSTSGTSVAGLNSASAGFGTIFLGTKTLTVTGTGGSFSGVIQDGGGVGSLVIGDGTRTASQTLGGANTYTGATTINANSMLFLSGTGSVASSSGVTLLASGATLDISNTTSGATVQDLNGVAGTTVKLGGQALTANPATSSSFAGTIQDTGSLIKSGRGTLTLSGNNSYSGGTALRGGTLAVGSNTALGTGTLTLSGSSTLQAATSVSLANAITTNATATVDTGSNTMTLSGPIGGRGALLKTGDGTLILSGTSNYEGTTIIGLGTLVVNGSITGSVAVTGLTTLSGSGTIGGSVSVAGAGAVATIAPGNSIGTLTIGGGYSQDATSTYQVEVNNSGLSDKLVITGAATLAGTLAVLAQPGKYQRTSTYTILTASGGVTGNFSTLTSSSASLTPSVVVAGNTVTLILLNSAAILPGSDTNSYTGNQGTIATVLNQAGTTITGGDLNTVLTTLSNLTPAQLAPILDALSGQNYSGFSSIAMQGSQVFMDSFQVQAGGGTGGSGASLPGGSTYQALKVDTADACETACDVEPLWGAWGGGMGAFGTVAGDSNSHGLTYNLGGFIAGLDRKFGPGFRAGVAAGFNAATLYTNGMPGTGTSNTLQFALYGEYAPGPFYLDALAGYGHSDNRMNRPIIIPGLPFRMAQGYTTANTFFGQLETGYKIPVAPSFGGFVTPFARLQASTSTQAGFSETGADSLNLTVAQQTTQSLRTVLGAQLGADIDAPWREKLDLVFRLGWSHEFADQTRPVTAAFAGAPALSFTTFGAQAPRDGVVLGLGANTQVAEHTSVYLRYDGDLAGGNTNHVLNAGVRYVW